MRIAIFENEFDELKRAFDGFNLMYFRKALIYEIFPSAQAFGNLKNLKDYDFVIIDIDLSVRSTLDGFQLLDTLLHDQEICGVKPIILTGQPPIKEKLKQKKLPEVPIILKPLVYTEIKKSFDVAKPIEAYR